MTDGKSASFMARFMCLNRRAHIPAHGHGHGREGKAENRKMDFGANEGTRDKGGSCCVVLSRLCMHHAPWACYMNIRALYTPPKHQNARLLVGVISRLIATLHLGDADSRFATVMLLLLLLLALLKTPITITTPTRRRRRRPK